MNVEDIAEKLLLLKERADQDSLVQEYLCKTELPGNLEYVRPERSGRRKGYFRKKPARDSPKQLKHRLRFSEIAYSRFGTKGVIFLQDGRIISKAAKLIGDDLKGTSCAMDPRKKEKEKLIEILSSREEIMRKIQAAWL